MVFDQRVFVTYNPFNLYVTQPEVKPGCILRRSNVNVLERDNLVTGKQVRGLLLLLQLHWLLLLLLLLQRSATDALERA
jgi:hypothetical protein